MFKDLFRAFIAGSSWFTFVAFFNGFQSLKNTYNIDNMKKIVGDYDPYYVYTIIAPIMFGINSIIAILISKIFRLHFRIGFIIISLISPLMTSLFIKLNDVYVFTNDRWIKQYIYLVLYHTIVYNLVIANIYSYLS